MPNKKNPFPPIYACFKEYPGYYFSKQEVIDVLTTKNIYGKEAAIVLLNRLVSHKVMGQYINDYGHKENTL